MAAELERLRPEERKYYEQAGPLDFNTPLPWAQGPRRIIWSILQPFDGRWANSFVRARNEPRGRTAGQELEELE